MEGGRKEDRQEACKQADRIEKAEEGPSSRHS